MGNPDLKKNREILFAKFPPGQVPEAADDLGRLPEVVDSAAADLARAACANQRAASAGVANAALANVVRQLSLAYGPRGVTAHLIAPGPADTERLRRVAADRAALRGISVDEVMAGMLAESSIGRFTTPEQVAWAVSILLAPEADAMTGSSLMLDSGRRRGLP